MIKLICEVGWNHNGNIDNAINIIDSFWNSCDIFKFQKMNPKEFLKKRYYEKNKNNVDYFGETYGEHREHCELTVEEHKLIQDYIESKGKKYSCSVHDLTSAKEIIPLNPYYIKIASCNCNNWKLIDYCLNNFSGMVHVSTGMTSKKERQAILSYSNNIIPYSCTSCYNGNSDVYIERMPGFSCHVPDITFAQAAILNGAKYIEYHCTIDRKLPGGSDQKISLLPKEYSELKKWINKNADKIKKMKFQKPNFVPESEKIARSKSWCIQ